MGYVQCARYVHAKLWSSKNIDNVATVSSFTIVVGKNESKSIAVP